MKSDIALLVPANTGKDRTVSAPADSQRRLARTLYPGAFCGPGELTRAILAGLAPQARRPM